MNSLSYLVIIVLLKEVKISAGIKFSAESYAEIAKFAEIGKTHLESLRESANVPQFGPCWKNAIENLQIGCKFLSENIQSDLALKFTDCFLQMSGHEPLICDLPKSVCLKKLSDRAFNAYTEFYTHTQSICYFLQSQLWHEETEKTIDKLSSTSHEVSQKLEEAGEVQEKLMNQQRESLSLQHDLNNHSKNIASVLKLSQDQINIFMKDFKTNTEEQKQLLLQLFENLVVFRAWAVKELSWFSSTVYIATVVFLSFFFTSVPRTREARLILFVLFALNYFFERILTSFFANNTFGNYFVIKSETLDVWVWSGRHFCVCLAILILLYTAFSYCDYNLYNHKLLLEIKNQNLKILDYFAIQAKSQDLSSKNIFNSIDYGSYSSGQKVWKRNLKNLSSPNENSNIKVFDSSKSKFHDLNMINKSNFYYNDVVDFNESDKINDISTVNIEETNKKKSKISYSLRSHKAKGLSLC